MKPNDPLFAYSCFNGVKTFEGEIADEVYYCGPEKMIHRFLLLSTLEHFTKEWLGGSYLVMNITPIVSGDRPPNHGHHIQVQF